MELAERIRKARQEAGLSQKQVCGDAITRNMLSQIENGSAQPSLATLQHLARQLGKPMGYFFGEEAPAPLLEQIRQLYAQEHFEQVLALLPQEPQTQEERLLRYLATLAIGEKQLSMGFPNGAKRLLEELEACTGLYITEPLQRQRLRLLAQCGDPSVLPADDLPLLLRAQAALAAGDAEQAVLLLTAAQDRDAPQWQLLRGEADFRRGLYATAAAYYRRAEEACPEQVIPRLEACYRELGDFRQAYAYAIKSRNNDK